MSFKDWYERNKTAFNKRRAEKYAKDPAYREKAAARQREYRLRNPTTRKRENTRVVNGVEVAVTRIGDVAKIIGRSEQVIRLWEKRKLIPPPTVQGSHRYYTENQIALLSSLAEAFNEVRYKPAIRTQVISKKSAEVFLLWDK